MSSIEYTALKIMNFDITFPIEIYVSLTSPFDQHTLTNLSNTRHVFFYFKAEKNLQKNIMQVIILSTHATTPGSFALLQNVVVLIVRTYSLSKFSSNKINNRTVITLICSWANLSGVIVRIVQNFSL